MLDVARQIEYEILALRSASDLVHRPRTSRFPVHQGLGGAVDPIRGLGQRCPGMPKRAHLDIAVVPGRPEAERCENPRMDHVEHAMRPEIADSVEALDALHRGAHLTEPLNRTQSQGLRRALEGQGEGAEQDDATSRHQEGCDENEPRQIATHKRRTSDTLECKANNFVTQSVIEMQPSVVMKDEMSVTELGITGMSCASCAAHVADALRGVDGVEDAAVNLATERARVTHRASLDIHALIQAVEGAGYEASAEIDDDADRVARETALARRTMVLGGALVLAIPTMLLAMFAPEFPYKAWVLASLAIPVWAIGGWDFHRGALVALRNRTATMDTLVSIGSTAALAIGYFETASAIITLILVGKYLEARAKVRSGTALRELLDLQPKLSKGIATGDIITVAPGERIPVDGVVVEGASTIDRSMFTGEAIPEDLRDGSAVEAGSVNGMGSIKVRATAVGSQTELARIIDIVRAAQGSMPPVQRLADRVSAIFVPVILAIAFLTFTGWLVTQHSWTASLVAAVAVLVVACPCALGLATPTAIIAGVGRAARIGVLFKDASSLEAAARVDTVAFDKTGTLTFGAPRVVAASDEALAVAAALEEHSTHPLARAISAAARDRGLRIPQAIDVEAARGLGIAGMIDGVRALVGNAHYLADAGIHTSNGDTGATHAYVVQNNAMLGRIDFSDEQHPQARATIAALRAMDVTAILVSGDAREPVEKIARALDISESHARATPVEKSRIIDTLRAEQHRVAFVGDGINDAPALAKADVGFAMGGGTAVALETAGVAILSNNPASVPSAIALARATMRTIKQNLFWALVYNVVLVPLAVIGVVTPVFAAAAMGLSSLFVVGNSLWLGRRRAT